MFKKKTEDYEGRKVEVIPKKEPAKKKKKKKETVDSDTDSDESRSRRKRKKKKKRSLTPEKREIVY